MIEEIVRNIQLEVDPAALNRLGKIRTIDITHRKINIMRKIDIKTETISGIIENIKIT
jgi:hypothetical protein